MHEKPSPADLEAHFKTYLTDEQVIKAFKNCSWFTPDYITLVRAKRPPLDQPPPLETPEDAEIKLFLQLFWDEITWGKVLKSASEWITKRMTGSHGHSFEIGNMPFFDNDVELLAKSNGVDETFELDREDAISGSKIGIVCIIAPPSLREKIVQIQCSWGDTYPQYGTSVLLQALLTRKGVEKYMETQQQAENT